MGTREFLGGIPVFADVLAPEQLDYLADHSRPAFFRAGTLLMSQDDVGGSMYAIQTGTALVNVADPGGRDRVVATLGPGEIVGEMSLFTGDRRTATVTASSNVDAIEISKAALEKVFSKSPDLVESFGKMLARRQAELRGMGRHAGEPGRDEFVSQARRFFRKLFGRGGASPR